MEIMRVSSESHPSALADAISATIRKDGQVELNAMGAGAVNQAVKAIATAKIHLENNGIELACFPEFMKIDINGQEKCAIRFIVYSCISEN